MTVTDGGDGIARVVLVTGAASGIGAAVARRLAGPDTALVLTTRTNAAGLDAVAEAAKAAGLPVLTKLADLAAPGAAAGLVEAACARCGRLDQIVSNAGRAQKARFGEFGATDLGDAFAVNTVPFHALVTAALPMLTASAWGRVVAISSFVTQNLGVNGAFFPATAAATGALEALARVLALQLASAGVTVNCVAPGFTRKVGGHAALDPAAWDAAAAATPTGRLAEPADIAAAVAFLLAREAGHVTGQILRVDGGLSLR